MHEMVQEPTIIKDLPKPIETSRKHQMDNDDPTKLLGGKGLVLKQHYTDKQRLDSILEEEKREEDYLRMLQQQHKIRNNRKQMEFSYERKSIVQPNLKFKHRNDLERIIESINKYSYGRVSGVNFQEKVKKKTTEEKKIVDDDLIPNESLEREKSDMLSALPKKDDLDSLASPSAFTKETSEIIPSKQLENKVIRKPIFKKKNKINPKNILNHLHHKTYFKGLTNFVSVDNNNENLNTIHTSNSNRFMRGSFSPPKTQATLMSGNNAFSAFGDRDTHLTSPNDKRSGLMSKGSQRILSKNKKNTESIGFGQSESVPQSPNKKIDINELMQRFPLKHENLDLIRVNPITYTTNMKKFRPNESKSEVENEQNFLYKTEQLNRLEGMLRKTNELNTENDNNKSSNTFRNRNSIIDGQMLSSGSIKSMNELDEYITVGGFKIPATQDKEIGKQVLKMCKFANNKNNNNPSSLKYGEGKLMMTNGLTINEFKNKFNLEH